LFLSNDLIRSSSLSHCLVKYQDSKETLLQGTLKNGLYVFDEVNFLQPDTCVNPTTHVSTTPTVLIVQRFEKSYDIWHNRLAHASRKIAKVVMKSSSAAQNCHPMTTRAKAGIFKPKVLLATSEPTTTVQALETKHWKLLNIQGLDVALNEHED
ncbi:unnamed protein product, partial [Sphenostylis stenocarpa]